jgi:predicted metal-binding protein
MDINEILKGVNCSACGKNHTCPIKYVYVENGAISHLDEISKEYKRILIVADENTYKAAGDKVKKALYDKETKSVIFPLFSIIPSPAVPLNFVKMLKGDEE